MKFGAFERVVGIVVGLCSTPCVAQETTSAPLAKQLAAALDAAKLDSIAARDPADPAVYVSALYLPGIEFLTIAAQYPAAELLNTRIARKSSRTSTSS